MHYQNNVAVDNELVPRLQWEPKAGRYIGNLTFDDFWDKAEELFPFLLKMIDHGRVFGLSFEDYVSQMNDLSWEFEDPAAGGRGKAYNLAQHSNVDNRINGIKSLLQCFSESKIETWGSEKIILDVLGGDGTLTRCLRAAKAKSPTIVSADLSSYMVNACLEQEFPCIRQSASRSLFRDSVLDGALIAYGSHHLDSPSRQKACAEAFRTLKNGGRLVLHDFEIGTPTARWFHEVVDPLSRTGHPHPHFSKEEMHRLFKDAGFKNISVSNLSDPFILRGATRADARKNALLHMYRMYDLVKAGRTQTEALDKLESCVDEIFGGIHIEEKADGYEATIYRQALVAVGTKIT